MTTAILMQGAKSLDTVGIEPTTFHMRSENHTPRPRAQLVKKVAICHHIRKY